MRINPVTDAPCSQSADCDFRAAGVVHSSSMDDDSTCEFIDQLDHVSLIGAVGGRKSLAALAGRLDTGVEQLVDITRWLEPFLSDRLNEIAGSETGRRWIRREVKYGAAQRFIDEPILMESEWLAEESRRTVESVFGSSDVLRQFLTVAPRPDSIRVGDICNAVPALTLLALGAIYKVMSYQQVRGTRSGAARSKK